MVLGIIVRKRKKEHRQQWIHSGWETYGQSSPEQRVQVARQKWTLIQQNLEKKVLSLWGHQPWILQFSCSEDLSLSTLTSSYVIHSTRWRYHSPTLLTVSYTPHSSQHANYPALFNITSLGKGWRVRKWRILFQLCSGVSRHTQHTRHARKSAQTQRFLFPTDRRLPLAVQYRVHPLVRTHQGRIEGYSWYYSLKASVLTLMFALRLIHSRWLRQRLRLRSALRFYGFIALL